jgi:hypothetical protein
VRGQRQPRSQAGRHALARFEAGARHDHSREATGFERVHAIWLIRPATDASHACRRVTVRGAAAGHGGYAGPARGAPRRAARPGAAVVVRNLRLAPPADAERYATTNAAERRDREDDTATTAMRTICSAYRCALATVKRRNTRFLGAAPASKPESPTSRRPPPRANVTARAYLEPRTSPTSRPAAPGHADQRADDQRRRGERAPSNAAVAATIVFASSSGNRDVPNLVRRRVESRGTPDSQDLRE